MTITTYALRERTAGHVLTDKAACNGSKPFVLFEDRVLSYEAVDRLSNALASGLASIGVKHGTHVAVLMANAPETVLAYFALGRLGAVAVTVNTAAKGQMLSYFVGQSDSEVLIIDADFANRIAAIRADLPKLRVLVTVGADAGRSPLNGIEQHSFDALMASDAAPPDVRVECFDPFMIIYTSGTTGPSKGVVISHASVLTQAIGIATACDYTHDDVLYTCLPLFHANAWWVSVLPAMFADATVAVSRRFSASRFWDDIRRYNATQFNMLGAMAAFLWNRPPDERDRDHRVRQALVAPTAEFFGAFEQRFGIKLKSLYGLTDGCIATIHRADDPGEKWKSAGRTIDYAEVRIVDDDDRELPRDTVGEIVMRGREPWIIALGYYKMPDATVSSRRNLWLHTGDRGYMDEDGYLYFVDRKKDSIRRRGENISSFEVEQIVSRAPGVQEVAAFAVRSEHTEDEVMISVVRAAGADLSEISLIQYCDQNMPYFMVPRFVDFIDALPKNMSEKVEKYKLRADAEARLTEIWDRERAGVVIRR